MSSISKFINNLYCWIYGCHTLHEIWIKTFRNNIGLLLYFEIENRSVFTWSLLFSFVEPLVVICCHSLLFVVTRCHSMYYSLSFVVSLIVICCHSLYNSLSLVIPLVVTPWDLLVTVLCETFCKIQLGIFTHIQKLKRDQNIFKNMPKLNTQNN